jgi:hypothetical protein
MRGPHRSILPIRGGERRGSTAPGPTRRRALLRSVAALALLPWIGGCGLDNGLPSDLAAHLAAHGAPIRATRSHAPLWSRAGIVFCERNPVLEARIVAAIGLARIEPGDSRFGLYASQVPDRPIALWGILGRPTSLRLRNGAQFELLYLLISDNSGVLFAEYAYG